jgi:hypothetical protein
MRTEDLASFVAFHRKNGGKAYAITMWDFSWLERQWPGAGYEDWDQALSELVERGYNAVRIDAYPHFIDADLNGVWELPAVWGVNDWGAFMRCRVKPYPALIRFIEKCAKYNVKVGLSSWYRRDTKEAWRQLSSPERHAGSWLTILNLIENAGLMGNILYFDLCNEWPMQMWAPFFHGSDDPAKGATMKGQRITWEHPKSIAWMQASIQQIRDSYPGLPLTVSVHPFKGDDFRKLDFLDLFEPHIWMAQDEFYERIGWTFGHLFDYSEYELLQTKGPELYYKELDYWHKDLTQKIENAAAIARQCQKPLMTTECWGITDYKDGPGLDWGWVKELCAFGTEQAASTGAWAAISTSNFCGPQFTGMWQDIDWHQRLTSRIKSSIVRL